MNRSHQLPLKNVVVNGRFWERYIKIVREKVIPYQWEALNDRIPDIARSHCIKNFEIAAGKYKGEYYGMAFQDSDLYKWLESVAYSLETHPDPELEKLADGAIELICAAQQPDGYINTYYTIKEPYGRFKNLREGHELYCAGHLTEAAVAYFRATGKRGFLNAAIRFADYIDKMFGIEAGQINGYPGHQEIELALFKLYEATGERRYLKLAEYFIRQRGLSPDYFNEEFAKPGYKIIFPELMPLDREYRQSHMPPVEQTKAIGHAVRAVYMYSAMADLAAELGDEQMLEACDVLYADVEKQVYITGAIGSASTGERFTTAYDLPNDLVYGETCASVGLMMFCKRLGAAKRDARYADILERALYNTVLAGMALSGTEFFYVNPLETEPRVIAANPSYKHVKPVRQKWFDCSCCPTNIARTVMNLGSYIYAASDEGLYINLYCAGSANDNGRGIEVKTEYPYGGEAIVKVTGGRFKLFLRDPEAAPVLSLEVNGENRNVQKENGYIVMEEDWNGDTIKLIFDMKPKRIYSLPEAQKNAGKTAVMRGPLVYCAEQVDNEALLAAYVLPADAAFTEHPLPCGFPDDLPNEAISLDASAYKYQSSQDKLYSTQPPTLEAAELKLIPYYLWANRGENEMRVYLSAEHLLPI